MGRLASGALVTMNACGRAIPSCNSDVWFFTTGAILRTGMYGELLELQRAGRAASDGPYRVGDVGLADLRRRPRRSVPEPEPARGRPADARLWDAIRLSALKGGAVVPLPRAMPARPESPDGVLPTSALTAAAS